MVDTKEIKESLQRELEALNRARDELKVQLQQAKSGAKDEWGRLENTFERLQLEVKRIGTDAKQPLREIGSATRKLVDELKNGYERAKRELKSSGEQQ